MNDVVVSIRARGLRRLARSLAGIRVRTRLIRLDQHLDASAARFHVRDAGGEIDDEPLATQHILAARYHHVAAEREHVATHVEFPEIAGRDLILLGYDDV